jgi:hypothetical protein
MVYVDTGVGRGIISAARVRGAGLVSADEWREEGGSSAQMVHFQ